MQRDYPAETVNAPVPVIALAGNANVGKSVIFNALTGMNQIIGNWPGKTVERAEGSFRHRGCPVKVIDLPGVYSFTAYSEEELVTRDYLAGHRDDVVVNVLDSTVLERNLYFTLQLVEMGVKLVIALNQIDLAARSGIRIDEERLSELLGVPVVKTAAVAGKGVEELVDAALGRYRLEDGRATRVVAYRREIEEAIEKVEAAVADVVEAEGFSAASEGSFPSLLSPISRRFLAIKLLEGDAVIVPYLRGSLGQQGGVRPPDDEAAPVERIVGLAARAAAEIERLHGESFAAIMAAERYAVCAGIVQECVHTMSRLRQPRSSLDSFMLHRVGGWIFFIVVMFGLFGVVFVGGDRISSLLDSLTAVLQSLVISISLPQWLYSLLWQGIFQGVMAGVSVALPYIVPFYIILSLLENSGYLARIAFLTDVLMHRLGLHGKAFIPIVLGIGCNVPAVLGTRIMEQPRGRFISGVLATIVPCSARTVVILGLVGVFMGFLPAITLYAVDLLVVFVVGRILNRMLPGSNAGLIMEMPRLKVPPFKVTARQTWFRLKDFITFAFPVIVVGSFVLYLLQLFGLLQPLSTFLAPFTEGFLGLPAITAIVLVFGILRKELALIMLAAFSHTQLLSTVLSPQQMYIFALIVMLYVPCISTIAVLRREFGARRAVLISVIEIAGALLLGGAVNWGWNLTRLLFSL